MTDPDGRAGTAREGRAAALAHRLAESGAAASRSRLRAALSRLQLGAWAVVQCALAATLGWLVASEVLDHERPVFAAIAPVVCLSTRQSQRLRRVAELAVGVSVGVLVGEALVDVIGRGAWQIGLVVAIALLIATALDGGPLLTAQAGLQAVFVVAVPPQPDVGELARWEDALVGGAAALVVAALLPSDPWRRVRRAAETASGGLVLALREASAALSHHDAQAAAEALSLARETQAALDVWEEALVAGHETARLSPLRRDPGGATYRLWQDQHRAVDRASRNSRVVLRRVLSALEVGEALPVELPALLDGLADLLCRRDDDDFAQACVAYGQRLDLKELGVVSVSATVALAQLRAAVVDLLEGLGWDRFDARESLPPIL